MANLNEVLKELDDEELTLTEFLQKYGKKRLDISKYIDYNKTQSVSEKQNYSTNKFFKPVVAHPVKLDPEIQEAIDNIDRRKKEILDAARRSNKKA